MTLVSLPRSTLLILATWLAGCEPITTSDPGPPGSTTAISAGGAQACALQANGSLRCWGKNGLVGDHSKLTRLTAVDVTGFSADVVSAVTGDHHSCALTGDGRVYCWGRGADRGQLGPTGDAGSDPLLDAYWPQEIQFRVSGGARFIAAGAQHTCVIQPLGEVLCWGDNSAWQVSSDAGVTSPAPVLVLEESGDNLRGAVAVAAGGAHTCIVSGVDARCWGSNDHGQLGSGATEPLAPTPVTVPLDAGVLAIAAGQSHTCASVGNGSVLCWGANGSGQLGDNLGFDSATPVSPGLPSGSQVVALAAGGDDTCAVTDDRGLWCWGDNTFGQIGDGSTLQRGGPVRVHDDIRNVSVGHYFACAVTGAGKAYCWGRNSDGQLGDGTTEERHRPTEVQGL